MLRILAHVAALIGLYLAFSFVLFLGLQVRPLYDNIGPRGRGRHGRILRLRRFIRR